MEYARTPAETKAKMIIAMLIWGSIGIVVRNIALPASVIALIRGGIGGVFLLLVALALKRRLSRAALVRNALLLAISGAALGANWVFLFEAYKTTTIANATLSYYLAPTMIVAASPFLLKEKMTPLKVACVIAALLGMVFISGVFTGAPGAGGWRGIGFGIAAAACYASLTLMNKFLKDIPSLEATIAQLGVSALVLLPYVLLTEDVSALSFDASAVIWLVVLGVVHTGLAFWFYFDSVPKLRAQTIAVISYIDPLTAIILAAVVLHEQMGMAQVVGAVLILGSVFVSEWRAGNRRQPLPPQ